MQPKTIILSVENLKMYFAGKRTFLGKTRHITKAIDGVSFEIRKGECFGLVGESGSGKTTVGRCILRALKPTSGRILFQSSTGKYNLTLTTSSQMKNLYSELQMIFQDPYASLNPRMTVFDIIGEPLLVHGMKSRSKRIERVKYLLNQVGLKSVFLNRYPHAFSGGQRQRIDIARALALNPSLIVADEPVSALDVSIQAQVINLLKDLQLKNNLSYLFIAHDLSVIGHLADRVAVMYIGRLVELTDVDTIFCTPAHPYTEALMQAVPIPKPSGRKQTVITLEGEIADSSNPPSGCHFHPRCQYSKDLCSRKTPDFREFREGHWVRCHYAEDLVLNGCELTFN